MARRSPAGAQRSQQEQQAFDLVSGTFSAHTFLSSLSSGPFVTNEQGALSRNQETAHGRSARDLLLARLLITVCTDHSVSLCRLFHTQSPLQAELVVT